MTIECWTGEQMKIESWHTQEDKARWKIVRTDNYTDVPGDIVTADEASGEFCVIVKVGDETKTLTRENLGISCEIRIVRKGR